MFKEHRPSDVTCNDTPLVWGGTPDENNYRMVEASWELNPVSDEVTQAYYNQIQAKTCRKGLIAVLKHMAENNINICGTRGYVYSSLGQAENVEHFNYYYANALTRGMGIRQKMIEIWESEQDGKE